MIQYVKGNLFDAETEAIVNTVNCVGVMGKGIALQFKKAYPQNFAEYQKACKLDEVQPGKMFIHETKSMVNPKYIINFPTKRHWKTPSMIEDIQDGLVDLIHVIMQYDIQSIAIPPLGCGNGGLNWNNVRPFIESALNEVPHVMAIVYEPSGSPKVDTMKVGTKKPKMTRSRALFISLMKQYSIPGYRLSLLEIQKLAYFLQELGEPLRLNFKKYLYGPYAENLNFVLQHMEGHYIRGYGDRNSQAQVYLLENSADVADDFLKDDEEANNRLRMVQEVIEGFETPYGLELLATVHWIMKEQPEIRHHTDKIIEGVHQWNDRKRRVFKPEHIEVALQHINELGLTTDRFSHGPANVY